MEFGKYAKTGGPEPGYPSSQPSGARGYALRRVQEGT